MIYDAFIFSHEFTCLDIRLHELESVVDKFVLVEADWTFQGDPKRLEFTRADDCTDKYYEIPIDVKRLTGDPHPNGSSWAREATMREGILEELAFAADDDYVILSDVDEVPAARTVEDAIKKLKEERPPSVAFQQESRFYWLNNRVLEMDYKGSQIMTVATLRRNGVQRMRDNRWEAPSVPWGWHFCNLGDADNFIRKLKSFAHEELNTPKNTDREFVEKLISERRVLDDAYQCIIANQGLPTWVDEHRDELAEYFWNPPMPGGDKPYSMVEPGEAEHFG
jgi:hypothetical protein